MPVDLCDRVLTLRYIRADHESIRAAHRQSGQTTSRKAGDRTADDGTTRAAHPQPTARRAHRRSGVLQRGTRPSRGPARSRTRARPEIRQDLRHPLAARTAAAWHDPGADRRGLHPAPRPPAHRPGPRTGRLRAGLRGTGVRRHPEEAVDIVGGLWRKDSGSHAELRKIAFTSAGLVVPSRDWLIGRPDEKVARAEPVRVPAQGRSPVRPVTPAELAARRRGAADRAPGHRVTAGDIAALRSVGELFRTLDDAYGGGHARQALVRYLEHELEPMLRGTYGEQTGRRLFAAAADLTRLAGLDLVRHRRARARPAVLRPGAPAGAGGRRPGVRGLRAGHHEPAGRLPRPRTGGRAARPGRPAGRRQLGAARRPGPAARRRGTRARGAGGRYGPARPRWSARSAHWTRRGRAMRCRTGRGSSTRRSSPTNSGTATGIFSSSGRRLSMRSGRCSCGRRVCAEPVVLPGRSRDRASWAGELDQACQLGAEAAAQAGEMRSVRAVEYVRDFERRLEPYRDAAAVRAYRDRVATAFV